MFCSEHAGVGQEQNTLTQEPNSTNKVSITTSLDQHDTSNAETCSESAGVGQDFTLWAGQLGCSPHGSSFLCLGKVKETEDRGLVVTGSSKEYKCCNPRCGKQFIPTYCCLKIPDRPHCVLFCGDFVQIAQKRLCATHNDVTTLTIYGDPKKYMELYTHGNHMFGSSKWGRGKSCNGCNTTEYKKK
jgi:hypothetical protein